MMPQHSQSFQYHYSNHYYNTETQQQLKKNYHNHDNNSFNIVHEILCDQDLSRAGNLFTMSNDILLDSFPTTLEILKNIIDNRKYANNLNEQSLVEIVLTKCISALRETKMIANYYTDLLDIIEICMKYNLNNNRLSFRANTDGPTECCYGGSDDKNCYVNTPHANIVSDILSTILLEYLDPYLSVKAVPVCIKLLQHQNIKRELLREICSYLNLVASRSPDVLIDHVYHIVNAIYRGNSCLSRLLFHLCEANVECIYPITKHLIKCLKTIDSVDDLIHILKIMYIVSLHHVQLIMVHLEDLIELLADEKCRDYVLDIIYSIANQIPIALEPYLTLFDQKSPYYDSLKIDKIIGLVGKSLKGKAEYCTTLLIQRIRLAQQKTSKTNSLTRRLNNTQRYSHQIINAQGTVLHDSIDDLDDDIYLGAKSHRSNRTNNSFRKSHSYCYRNTNMDSDEYHMIANNSINAASQSVDPKLCVQILGEIYSIATVHPHVLDTCYKPLCELYQNNTSDNDIKSIMDCLKQLQSASICSIDHIDSNEMTNDFNSIDSIENECKTNKQVQSDHDYEVIKKDDLIHNKKPNQNELQQIQPKNNQIMSNFNDSITYSLLNTKITEEIEDDIVNDCLDEAKKPDLLTNSFAYLKLSDDKTSLELKSLSLRETNDHLYRRSSNNSHSYSANSKSNYYYQGNKDVVQQFCEKHLDKIKSYIKNLNSILAMPAEETILNRSYQYFNTIERKRQSFFMKKFKNKKFCSLNFSCQCKSDFCLYNSNYFEIVTFFPSIWIHIIFLSIQSKLERALSQQDSVFIDLKNFYEHLNEKNSFVTLITSSFPSERVIEDLINELKDVRFFDLFQWNSACSTLNSQWQCYMCSNPEKAIDLLNEKTLIQGQLKEKHGKWKFLRRWRTRLYTLTGGNIVYFKKDMRQESLSVRYIRSIQTLKSPGANKRDIPKSFEIFTDTNSYILKAENSEDAELWIQYLQLSKAMENVRSNLIENNTDGFD